jgi:threonine aldolase
MIDLRSDNASQPSPGMRLAMARAAVGDATFGEDPSVRALEERVAELLGKEAAVFMPSGTMCNVVAYSLYCASPDKAGVLLERTSHPVYSGYCAPEISPAVLRPVNGRRGVISSETLRRELSRTPAKGGTIAVLSLENPHNRAGGAIWPLDAFRDISELAHREGVPVHLDGARLPNAVAATGIDARAFCHEADSAWIDLSKGLGCPSGAVMAGSQAFVQDAKHRMELLGGGLHQGGVLAAAGLYALENHWTRVSEDNNNAQQLATGLEALGYDLVFPEIETNLVYFRSESRGLSATRLVERLRSKQIRMKAISDDVVRAVTHLNITMDDVAEVIRVLRDTQPWCPSDVGRRKAGRA